MNVPPSLVWLDCKCDVQERSRVQPCNVFAGFVRSDTSYASQSDVFVRQSSATSSAAPYAREAFTATCYELSVALSAKRQVTRPICSLLRKVVSEGCALKPSGRFLGRAHTGTRLTSLSPFITMYEHAHSNVSEIVLFCPKPTCTPPEY
jgi:hypothetical protein